MAFTVSIPDPSEAPAIAELHVATWREAYSHLLPEGFFTEEHMQMRHNMWERVLSVPRPEWSVRVARSDGALIGLALAGPNSSEPDLPRQLYCLYVAEAHHGSGAGQALLEAVIGTGAAMLWVAQQNPRAIAFYRRNGFEPDGTEQIDPGAPNITDARMIRH